MDETEDNEAPASEEQASAQAAPPAEPAPQAEPASPAHAAADAWFAQWYPEASPAGHPAPYLSGAWHHAQAALADLKARLAAL